MKSVPLNKFVPGYVKIIKEALRKNEEVIVTRKNLPYFKITPLRPEVSYTPVIKQNPAPRSKGKGKSKGKKFSIPYLIG